MKEGYQSLSVWQKSMTFVKEVYFLTEMLPAKEKFGLADQMRRAAVSIPSNIAEGNRRGSKKEYSHFLYIARGSLAEIETQAILAQDLYPQIPFSKLLSPADEIGRMLFGLARILKE